MNILCDRERLMLMLVDLQLGREEQGSMLSDRPSFRRALGGMSTAGDQKIRKVNDIRALEVTLIMIGVGWVTKRFDSLL